MSEALPYRTEYAKSGRAGCKKCKKSISKDEFRLACMIMSPRHDGRDPLWYHFDCFFQTKFSPNGVEEFANFEHLRFEDQKRLEEAIEDLRYRTSTSVNKGKKRKVDSKFDGDQKLNRKRKTTDFNLKPVQSRHKMELRSNNASKLLKTETDIEDKLKKQSDKMFKFIEELKCLSRQELLQLFEANDITFVFGESNKRYEVLSDALTFGRPENCPNCGGHLRFKVCRYVCTGNITEWEKCDYETENPKRRFFVVPETLKSYDFLSNYKGETGKRVFNTKLKHSLDERKRQQLDQLYNAVPESVTTPDDDNYKNTIKLNIHISKNIAVADAETGLENEAHVLKEGGTFHNAFLVNVDVAENKNSFYKLQVLESDHDHNHYWIFRSWGRVGVTLGTRVNAYNNKFEAIKEFEKLYTEKTNNQWGESIFCKKSTFYSLVNHSDLNTKFKVPLSKTRFLEAQEMLINIKFLLMNRSENLNKIYAIMNKFYSLVPHNFGNQPMKLIKSSDILLKGKMIVLMMNNKII